MYQPPSVSVLGSLAELTQTTITKNAGSGDVIVINGVPINVPGNGVVSVS
jgi:hypothetical protein